MGADQHQDWQALAASALDWWREAGVDMLVEEAPRDWLTPVAAPARVAAQPVVAPAASVMPETLPEFLAWRTSAAAPEAEWSGPWLPGSTAEGPAPLMVLADCPDREDIAEGALLSGTAGRLLDAMLAAIGLDRAAVPVAALAAKRPIAGRLPPEATDRLAEIAREHVALVAPARLLLLGDAASRAILGMTVREAQGSLRPFNHRMGKSGVVATYHPRLLIERPIQKAQAWRDLRLVMHGQGE